MLGRLCFILISSQNICFGYLLESPQLGDSKKYPKHMLLKVLLHAIVLHNIISYHLSSEYFMTFKSSV